ncbi:unnamed protein product [Microthlaspi erraticum]|uniref:Uncharacterized protein n=1 Tax=Microthlaspi erraticum TaxID=1685480 RepID=A0A6D2HE59_9BRAS|nr:unnamed protein product [Microthlaspi erraticum]
MAFPEKKRKKMEEPSSTLQILTQNPSLPDELLMTCVARTSRLDYPTLSLVSKSFGSLLASPELYKVRSMLGHTDLCLYVCFKSSYESRLFTLCRKPDQTLTLANKEKKKKTSSGYALVRVPLHHSPGDGSPVLVAVGSDIYNIGSESYYNEPSSSVSVMDCRFHTWHETTSKRVDRMLLSASVVDRKIYVAGSHKDSLEESFEVFDTETQVWETLPIPPEFPPRDLKDFKVLKSKSECFEGKFHVNTHDGVFCYNPKEGRWDKSAPRMSSLCFSEPCCEIGNVLYTFCDDGVLIWFDTKVRRWRNLKSLVGLPRLPPGVSGRMVDYGGNMVVLWDENLRSSGEKMIWCAEIALERCENCKIWGKVEWFDHVLTVPMGYSFGNVVVATV